jgi:methionine synthase II (cobalamin-independent)
MRHIAHRDLCIQWDFCNEMILIDGQHQEQFPRLRASIPEIMERMRRISAPVPDDVELGIHLCYGDFGAKHFIEPVDAGKMVEAANALAQSIEHPLAYVHMPVPINRTDDAFFRPLRDLTLAPATELYLGVVARDGADGTRLRIKAAAPHVGKFGIATECGMARARKLDLVLELLDIHADVARDLVRHA